MAFIDCIDGKVKEKLITSAQADEIKKMWEVEKRRRSVNLGDDAAGAASAEIVVKAFADKMIKKRFNAKAHANRMIELFNATDGLTASAKNKFFRDLLEEAAATGNAMLERALRGLEGFTDKHAKKFGVIASKENGMEDVFRSIIDGTTDGQTEAAVIGKKLSNVSSALLKLYRQAGGIIGEIPNWTPQVHTAERLRAVSRTEWVDFISDLSNIEDMQIKHGFANLDDDGLKEMFSTVYDSITSGGRSSDAKKMKKSLSEGKTPRSGKGGFDQKRDFARFIIFKDADSFLKYNERFGVGREGLYDLWISHFRGITRDIGMMRVFGPNVRSGGQFIDSLLAHTDGATDMSRKFTRGMFSVAAGDTDGVAQVGGAGETMWNLFNGLQNLQKSAYLGSAVISAVTDPLFISGASRMAGLRPMGVVKAYVSMLKGSDINMINRSRYNAEAVSGSMSNSARLTGDTGTVLGGPAAWAAKAGKASADFTMSASGLNSFTDRARGVARIEALGTVWDYRNKSWQELPQEMRDYMKGISAGADDWAEWRKAKPLELRDGVFVADPQSIHGDSAIKLDTWVASISQLAVNDPSVRTRAITTGAGFVDDARQGTFLRAMFSSATMFKSFPITVMHQHMKPAVANLKQGKWHQMGEIVVAGTFMGAMAIQMKELLKGNDPREMDSLDFLFASLMQGGGMGIYGDFLFSDLSRFDQTPIDTLAGPTVGLLNDSYKLFKKNFDKEVLAGKDSSFAADAFKLLSKNTPAANLWYARALIRRGIFDTIGSKMDDGYMRKLQRQEREREKKGQGTYWKSGDFLPSRTPNSPF